MAAATRMTDTLWFLNLLCLWWLRQGDLAGAFALIVWSDRSVRRSGVTFTDNFSLPSLSGLPSPTNL